MEIPYFVLLIGYLILLGGILILAAFNLWHMVRFGMFDFAGKMHTFIYVSFSIAILAITFLLMLDVPWFDTFRLGGFFSFGGGSNQIEL